MALIFGSLPTVATHGAPAAAQAVPSLHGRQILTSTDTARTVVSIDRDVSLPGQANCLLSDRASFAGTAEQAAVVLTELPATPQSRIVWIARLTYGDKVRQYDSECLSTSIPPGRYLLQLVHTAGTSTVRLSLPGLAGKGRLRVTGHDDSTAADLPEVITSSADPATKSWGTRQDLAGQGSVLTIGTIAAGTVTNQGADAQGDCLLGPDEEALPDPVAYAPGCPAGGSGQSQGFTGVETYVSTITSNLAPGSYGAGFWFIGTPTHDPLGAASFWLTNLS